MAEQSPALRSLVSGFMEETQTGTVIWEEVDKDIFARFAQFIYTGDYPPPSHDIIEFSQAVTHNDTDIEEDIALPAELARNFDDGFGSFATSKKGKKKRPPVVEHIQFHDIVYKVPFLSKFTAIYKIRLNESSAEDYTPISLRHAQLYVLAGEWDIKPLKALVLSKLYATIYEFKPYKARYYDVVELIRYTYENTLCRKRIDPLRGLVTQSVAHEQT